MPITEDGISSGHKNGITQQQMNAALSDYMLSSQIVSALSSKMNNPIGLTSQYVNGAGGLTTFPAIPSIQRTRVQTDVNGNYTWVYPIPYANGIIPVLTAVSESSSSTVPQGVQIVGVPTNISATFKVINLPSTSVLSVVVLGAPTAAQAFIHLTAIAP